MAECDGTEPVEDDETLFRRVPVNPKYYNPEIDPLPTPLAFRPREDDKTGLSVSRAKYTTMFDVVGNPRDKSFYVAVLVAGSLGERGIRVEPAPEPGDPGHVELPDLRYDNRSSREAEEWQV